MTPAWILDILAAGLLVVAAVSAVRLAVTRPGPAADIDVASLLTAIAMAGLLTAGLSTLSSVAWEVIFGLLTAWFTGRVVLSARRSGTAALAGSPYVPLLVLSAAMLYVFLGMIMPSGGAGGMSGMAGMSAGTGGAMTLEYPTLAFAFALCLIGYSVWDIDQLSAVAAAGPRTAARGARGVLLLPGVTVGGRIAAGVVLAVLLLITL